jgi:hypothetical protein
MECSEDRIPSMHGRMKAITMAKSRRLEVDRRVGIALSVLPPSQQSVINRIINSPRDFARLAGDPGRVQLLHSSGQPLYLMRVTPRLRLVYTMIGETVYVLDLVERATLDRFARLKVGKKVPKARERTPKSRSRKSADVVDK